MKRRAGKEKSMKNLEINKKLGFKVVAVLTGASMVLGGLAGCGSKNAGETSAVESTQTDADEELLTGVMDQVIHRSSVKGDTLHKDEVVYVMADAMGNTQKVIVSDSLKNVKGDSTITDASSLTDIKNVKGNEDYTVDADGNLVWNADGNDITYQGTTDKALPVDVKITYEYEGKEIDPQELIGKTGDVTIRFTYTNKEKTTVEVNGKEKEVYVPFAMISGALLPAEHFSDIEVTNGKILSEGDNTIVIGMAFPGLKDSINIDSLKEKAVDDKAREKLDDMEIPETVEIHAYATDFTLNQTMTMAMPDLLSDLNLGDTLDIDTSELTDSMDELQDATQQLKDGSAELNDGAATLQDGAQTLADKSKDLDKGAGDLKEGALALDSGAESLNSGAGELKSGIDQVDSGVQTLKNGTSSLVSGASQLNSGAGQLKDGIYQAAGGVSQLKAGFESTDPKSPGLIAGYKQVEAGVDTLIQMVQKSGALTSSMTNAAAATASELEEKAIQNEEAADNAGSAPEAPSFEESAPSVDVSVPDAGSLTKDEETGIYNADEVEAYMAQVNDYISAMQSYQSSVSDYANEVGSYQGAVSDYAGAVASYSEAHYASAGRAEAYKDAASSVAGTGTAVTADGESGSTLTPEQQIAKLQAGMKLVENGINKLDAGVNVLASGEDGKGGMVALKAGADQLVSGTSSAVDGAKQLDDGASQLKSGTSQLSSGAQSLMDGTQTLKNGTSALLDGTITLKDGTTQFVDGTAELNDGAVKLLDGTGELMDGLFTFDEEGISKLTDLFGDNVQDVIDELKAVCEAGEGYRIYSDSASDMDSSVKFIYKTEAVK